MPTAAHSYTKATRCVSSAVGLAQVIIPPPPTHPSPSSCSDPAIVPEPCARVRPRQRVDAVDGRQQDVGVDGGQLPVAVRKRGRQTCSGDGGARLRGREGRGGLTRRAGCVRRNSQNKTGVGTLDYGWPLDCACRSGTHGAVRLLLPQLPLAAAVRRAAEAEWALQPTDMG